LNNGDTDNEYTIHWIYYYR